MCVVSVIVKRCVLPPCVVDGRSRNPLYYYYYYNYYKDKDFANRRLCVNTDGQAAVPELYGAEVGAVRAEQSDHRPQHQQHVDVSLLWLLSRRAGRGTILQLHGWTLIPIHARTMVVHCCGPL